MFENWRLTAFNISAYLADYYYTRDSSLMVSFTDTVSNLCSPMLMRYDYWMSLSDPRVHDWPLMSSPWPTIAIVLCYFYACLRGPRYMDNQKAFTNLKPCILLYNLLTAGLNGYIAFELWNTLRTRKKEFHWTCESVDYSNLSLIHI